MKVCYIVRPGTAPRLPEYLMVKVTPGTFLEVVDQYKDYPMPLCLVVARDVNYGALLKFIEGAPGDLAVVVYRTPDQTFLSRFSQTIVWAVPKIRPFPDHTSAQAMLKECQSLCL